MSVFTPDAFANPANEFRPLQIVHGMDRFLLDPANLTGEEGIDRYFQHLRAMGTGGIVANVSFNDYLVSPRQWEIYRHGLRTARELGMVLWLYDEKGYPSGAAGGIVPRAFPEFVPLGIAEYRQTVSGPATIRMDLPVSCRRCLAAFAIADDNTVTDLTEYLDGWDTLRWQAPQGNWTMLYLAERVMYEGTHASANVSQFKQYVNLLNPRAVKAFLRVTHQQYLRETPADVWQDIRAMFTDEPSFMVKYMPELPERYRGKVNVFDAPLFTDRPLALPWVDDLFEQFTAMMGYDLRPHLAALFEPNLPDAAYVRQDYFSVITRLYADAFYGQVRDWCRVHDIAASGHVLAEEFITDHVIQHGSLFAVMRKMDLPGIDALNADPISFLANDDFMTPKQVSSAAHLIGARQVHSESSDYAQHNEGRSATLEERRGQGNLQYVLGVNQITSYFSWETIGEEGWRSYNDYMGRLASLLTGGRHCCDIAVLYPIRTMWAHFTPDAGEDAAWVQRYARPYPNIVRALLRNQLDLDIIDEEAIVAGTTHNGMLCVAEERYRAIVLPPLYALGLETLRALATFVESGGLLICVDTLPEIAESAANTPELQRLCATLFGNGGPALRVMAADLPVILRAWGLADLTLAQSNENILYTHRQLEGRHIYFVTNNAPTPITITTAMRAAGPYTLYRPVTGEVFPLENTEIALAGFEGLFVTCAG